MFAQFVDISVHFSEFHCICLCNCNFMPSKALLLNSIQFSKRELLKLNCNGNMFWKLHYKILSLKNNNIWTTIRIYICKNHVGILCYLSIDRSNAHSWYLLPPVQLAKKSVFCKENKGREREMYFQVKHINMDMDMICQLIQMAKLDGDAMVITDLLPATPRNLVLILILLS